ncbi:MAG: peptidase S41 [Croceicoccus sp.]|nr:peptidase S41 [Croceicoccus sp.]
MGSNSASRWNAVRQGGNMFGALAMVLAVTGCGGGSGESNGTPVVVSPSPTPSSSPTPTSSNCSLSARQDWARSVLSEWYLFPDLIDSDVRKSDYNDLQSYIDALVAPAYQQEKDRGWTYLTSIEEEEAYYSSGSTQGFGMLLVFEDSINRLRVREAFENAPAFAAGIDRGTEILAAGRTAESMKLIADMNNDELIDALLPDDGSSRVIRFMTREPVAGEYTFKKPIPPADYNIEPLSPRYGYRVFSDRFGKTGYIHLRSFIGPAEDSLREAFRDMGEQGVDRIMIDVRYNGGGLVRTANILADLMNKGREGQLWSRLELRNSKSANNEDFLFGVEAHALSPDKIAFIATDSSASASELIMNGQIPYSGGDTVLVGTNTYGKPVGQYAFDLEACDDRLRVVTFRTVNADGNADYFGGMASAMPNTCAARDNLDYPLGSLLETLVLDAQAWLNYGTCYPPITATAGTQATRSVRRKVPMPKQPNIAQIETPGLF